ncbi:PIN domain-containing protein [Bordetella muralis]|jgi:tRNA(fMet)-specific endonuclease VapC|uniref:PIN domain-containing protein n=1 Tax=Bordetella muralis TaxID=1649130 RepID=UPI0039EFAC59
MAKFYLLDTNILIAALKRNPLVIEQLQRIPEDSLRLSTVVLGELYFEAEKSQFVERNRAKMDSLVHRFIQVGVDQITADCYGRIRAALEKQGTPIGANDLWIAAQALSIDATLVTDNQREFDRVTGLTLENWLHS